MVGFTFNILSDYVYCYSQIHENEETLSRIHEIAYIDFGNYTEYVQIEGCFQNIYTYQA